jgi:hypothetical protein
MLSIFLDSDRCELLADSGGDRGTNLIEIIEI